MNKKKDKPSNSKLIIRREEGDGDPSRGAELASTPVLQAGEEAGPALLCENVCVINARQVSESLPENITNKPF